MPKVYLQDSLLLFPETGVHPPILVNKEGEGAAIVRVSIVATSVRSAQNNLERAIKSARDPSSDFYARNQILEWEAGDEGTQEIEIVSINEDAIVELPEMFYISIRADKATPNLEFGLDRCYCFILDGDGSSFFSRYVAGGTPSPSPNPSPTPSPNPTPTPTPTPAPPPTYASEQVAGYSLLAHPKHVEWGEQVFCHWQTPTGSPEQGAAIAMLKEGDPNQNFETRLQQVNIFSDIIQQHAPNTQGTYHFKYMPAGRNGNYNSVATSNIVHVHTPGTLPVDEIQKLNPILYADTQEKNLNIEVNTGYKVQQVRSYVGQGLTQTVLDVMPVENAYRGTTIVEFDGQKEHFLTNRVDFPQSQGSLNFLVNPWDNWQGALFSSEVFMLDVFITPITNANITNIRYVDQNQSRELGVIPTREWTMLTFEFSPTKIELFVNTRSIGSATGSFSIPGFNESAIAKKLFPFPSHQADPYHFKGQLMSVAFFSKLTTQSEKQAIAQHWREKFGLSLN